MDTDLTFFTNEKGHSLLDKLKISLENNTKFFDALVIRLKNGTFLDQF